MRSDRINDKLKFVGHPSVCAWLTSDRILKPGQTRQSTLQRQTPRVIFEKSLCHNKPVRAFLHQSRSALQRERGCCTLLFRGEGLLSFNLTTGEESQCRSISSNRRVADSPSLPTGFRSFFAATTSWR